MPDPLAILAQNIAVAFAARAALRRYFMVRSGEMAFDRASR